MTRPNRDDALGFALVVALGFSALMASCDRADCPEPPQTYEEQKNALVGLYDWNSDGCVRGEDDSPALDAISKARGTATALNGWAHALGHGSCE